MYFEVRPFTFHEAGSGFRRNRSGTKGLPSAAVRLFLISALITGVSTDAWSQLNSLRLDLGVNYASFQSQDARLYRTNLRNFGQFYSADLDGYVITPRMLTFAVSSTLTDYSLTSSYTAFEQSDHNRYLGYYNASATLFPDNSYPLTLYASRHGTEHSFSRPFDPAGYTGATFFGETRVLGLRWSLVKNTYYPQLEITLEKNERNDQGNLLYGVLPYEESTKLVGLRASNTSDDGVSGYNFYYTGRHIEMGQTAGYYQMYGNNPWLTPKRAEHEFRLDARSAVATDLSLRWDVLFNLRPFDRNRSINFGGEWIQNPLVRHQFTVVDNGGSYEYTTESKYHVTDITERTYLQLATNTHGMLGADVFWSESKSAIFSSSARREKLYSEVTHTTQVGAVMVMMRAGLNGGAESYSQGKKFVHSLALGLGGQLRPVEFVEILLSDDFTHSRNYYFGNEIQNIIRLRSTLYAIPRCVLEAEVSRDDFRYLQYPLFPDRYVSTVIGRFRADLTMSTSFDTEVSQSWWRSSYNYETNIIKASFVQTGLLRQLTLRLQGQREYNSFAGFAQTIVEGIADWAFYAFTFRARYGLRTVAGYRTQELFFEVRRPFSFNFR